MLTLQYPGVYSYSSTNLSSNVAAFDLDWTLVRTIRGRFPKDVDDWAILPNRLSVLKEYTDAGYNIAIFTNQRYKGKNLTKAINRINNIINYLITNGINPWVFVAISDESKKPSPYMWLIFSQFVTLNRETSFYCGDAAGRPTDFSDSDKQFAINDNIRFYTPEEVFPNNRIVIPETQTMFIFVGMPGSGKTTFYEEYLSPRGYVHINQDTLKTKNKVLSTLKKSLQEGKSVAVDATNPSSDKRREYINLAVEYQVPTMILYFVGNGYERNKLRSNPVPNIAYSMYYKHLVEPNYNIDYVPVVELL